MLKRIFLPAILCCVLLINSLYAQVRIITTIAGSDDTGYCNNCVATTYAAGGGSIAVDRHGNVFLNYNNRIRKVNTSGIITTIAGTGVAGYTGDGGPATAATIRSIGGIAVDSSGNVYFTDNWANGSLDSFDAVIRKIDNSGIITTFAGIPGGYTGYYTYSGDGGAATNASIGIPEGIVADISGNIYFADPFFLVVRKINTSGIITTYAGCNGFGHPCGSYSGTAATANSLPAIQQLAIDDIGNLYIAADAGTTHGYMWKVDAAGNLSTFSDFGWNGFLAIDDSGNIYTDNGFEGAAIGELSSASIQSCVAGCLSPDSSVLCDGCPATAANVGAIYGIATDHEGNIYIGANGNRIRKIHMGTFTGVSEIKKTCLAVAPNPAINQITVTSGENINHLELWTPLGQLLHDEHNNTKSIELNISNLQPGIYYIKVNEIQVERFVKE